MSLRRHKYLYPQTTQIIRDVYNYLKKEATEGAINQNDIEGRTITATNITKDVLLRILKEAEKPNLAPNPPVLQKIKQKCRPSINLTDLEKCFIRRYLHNLYVDKERPSIAKLRLKLRSAMGYKGVETSLGRAIRLMGFLYKKTLKIQGVIIEKYQIRLERINFLLKINEYREDNRPIVYLGELYIQSISTKLKDSGKKCVVVLHAGSEAGFVSNALLTLSCASGSDDLDYDKYRNWIENQLIPNLPPKSVVVLHNATYLNDQYDETPQVYSKKCDMQAWLAEKGIPFTAGMLKPQLYELIKLNKDSHRKYKIDQILSQHGHDVLHLPVHQQDLNPMELAWVEVKSCISSQNAGTETETVIKLVKEKLELLEVNEWKTFCDRVKAYEEEYRRGDIVMDQLSEEFLARDEDSDTDSKQDGSSDDDELCLVRR